MNRARQFRLLTIGLLLALLWLPGEASAAQCGSTAAGFEAWKGNLQAKSTGEGRQRLHHRSTRGDQLFDCDYRG